MPRKKRIEQYEHKGKTRVSNPEVGLVDAALEPPEQKKTYAYYQRATREQTRTTKL
jgi:hypothetical protein